MGDLADLRPKRAGRPALLFVPSCCYRREGRKLQVWKDGRMEDCVLRTDTVLKYMWRPLALPRPPGRMNKCNVLIDGLKEGVQGCMYRSQMACAVRDYEQ